MKTSKDARSIDATQTVEEVLSPVVTQISAALRQIECSLGPVLKRLKEWSDAAAPVLKKFLKWSRTVDVLNEIGWLPYHSAPFHYVEECGDDLALLDSRFSNFYRTQWNEVRDDMKSRLADYHIDDEARETFREALSAHEAEYYRCVCRVLFPEIERMIGAGRVGSKQMLKGLTKTGELSEFAFKERFDYVLFSRLVNHTYEQVNEDERERFDRDPVPNRHAAMHSLVPYSTHKHSMNMLILTDYVFRILPPIKNSQT